MKAIVGIILFLFLGAMTFSLFHVSLDMSGGMSDCPFISHEEVLCPMDLVDHISAWKSAFLGIVPVVVLVVLIATSKVRFSAVVSSILILKSRLVLISHRWLREQTYTFSYRALQEFFSNGILHPKLF